MCPVGVFFAGGYTADRGPYTMTQPTGEPSAAPHVIDTSGDANLASTYAAVVVVEVFVLAALWFFSRYYS